jgi:hypothetical protein
MLVSSRFMIATPMPRRSQSGMALGARQIIHRPSVLRTSSGLCRRVICDTPVETSWSADRGAIGRHHVTDRNQRFRLFVGRRRLGAESALSVADATGYFSFRTDRGSATPFASRSGWRKMRAGVVGSGSEGCSSPSGDYGAASAEWIEGAVLSDERVSVAVGKHAGDGRGQMFAAQGPRGRVRHRT